MGSASFFIFWSSKLNWIDVFNDFGGFESVLKHGFWFLWFCDHCGDEVEMWKVDCMRLKMGFWFCGVWFRV